MQDRSGDEQRAIEQMEIANAQLQLFDDKKALSLMEDAVLLHKQTSTNNKA